MAQSQTIQELAAEIHSTAGASAAITNGDAKDQRARLLLAARSLVAALELDEHQQGLDDNDNDEAWKFAMSPASHVVAQVAWKTGLLVAPWPKPVMTTAELAEVTSPRVEPIFIGRLLRVLRHYGVFEEVGPDTFRHTPLSLKLSTGVVGATCKNMAQGTRGVLRLLEYLDKFGYGNPGDAPSLFQWSNQTDQDLFHWMNSGNAGGGASVSSFNESMASSFKTNRSEQGKTALDQFPFAEILGGLGGDGKFAIVDVGGGYGHVIKELRSQLPADVAHRGQFVLEDLAETLRTAPLDPSDGIELLPYDFFREQQPVKGATFYIFRHILHDWSDAACRRILQSTVPVLEKGQSRILLVEEVVPAASGSAWTALIDINLLCYGGMNRTMQQWQALAASAGLRVAKVWPAVRNDQVIELVPEGW